MKRTLNEDTSDRWSRKQFKRRKAEEADSMRDWKVDLDAYLTQTPEDAARRVGDIEFLATDG